MQGRMTRTETAASYWLRLKVTVSHEWRGYEEAIMLKSNLLITRLHPPATLVWSVIVVATGPVPYQLLYSWIHSYSKPLPTGGRVGFDLRGRVGYC